MTQKTTRIGGVNIPIGVLIYWLTTNTWNMGQQYLLIHNNPAPGTPAYIDWEEDQVLDWLIRYWQGARRAGLPVRADFADFHRDYEFMGVQRHLKVLGIFARLYHRDGKDGYLKDLPRVMKYLLQTSQRYRDLAPLARLLQRLEGITPQTGYTF